MKPTFIVSLPSHPKKQPQLGYKQHPSVWLSPLKELSFLNYWSTVSIQRWYLFMLVKSPMAIHKHDIEKLLKLDYIEQQIVGGWHTYHSRQFD